MKWKRIIGILFFLFAFSLTLRSQDSCKVLLPALQGTYQGDCKRGLAHGDGYAVGKDKYKGHFKKGYPDGMGTYVWADGSIYTGAWKMGKREGEGSFTFWIDGHDSTLTGLWKDDEYIGKAVRKPTVTMNKFVDSYSFQKLVGAQDQVYIKFIQNGNYNTRVENVMLQSSSGTLTQRGQYRGFDNVIFPVTITVRYDTYNKMGTRVINCFIEFTIYEPGDWLVRLYN
jgi:hypothetical protein